MPRQRRTHRARVGLAGLIERAQYQNPYSRRPSRIQSRPTGSHIFGNHSRNNRVIRSGHTSRSTALDIGTHPVWNMLVQPISILHWLPMRRSMRKRRSCRSRSRRSQRNNCGGTKSNYDTTKIGSQSRMPVAEVEMPCCATESPTAEVQLSSNINVSCQQPGVEEQHFTPPHSTVILHQNPLFDAEGNTRSGLIDRTAQRAKIDKAKSRWNVRCNQTAMHQSVCAEPKDAEKKRKSGVKNKVPAKASSGTEDSSAASMNSPSTADSGASSDKSKTYTDESNSYGERIGIDMTTHEPGDVKLEERAGFEVAAPAATNMSRCMVARSVSIERSALIDLTCETPPSLQLKDESNSSISSSNVVNAANFKGASELAENIETMYTK